MSHDDLHLDLLLEFDFDDFAAAEQTRASDQRQATTTRTRARINARRAKSEAHLAEILPAQIEDGDAWHVLSAGDVDSLSYLAHLLKNQPMDYVMFSTWCMAREDVARLGAWLADGRIGRMDAYVGEIFPNQYSDEHAALCETVRRGGGARLHLPQPFQNLLLPRRRAALGNRIQRQYQHQPARRKHHHHRRRRPVCAPPGLFQRCAQLRPRLRRLDAAA